MRTLETSPSSPAWSKASKTKTQAIREVGYHIFFENISSRQDCRHVSTNDVTIVQLFPFRIFMLGIPGDVEGVEINDPVDSQRTGIMLSPMIDLSPEMIG